LVCLFEDWVACDENYAPPFCLEAVRSFKKQRKATSLDIKDQYFLRYNSSDPWIPLNDMRSLCEKSGKLFGIGLVCLQLTFFSTAFAQAEKTTGTDIIRQQSLDEIRKKGFAYLQTGNWEFAGAAFEKALAIDPKDALSLYGESLALFNLKQVQAADSKLEAVFEILAANKENNQLLADSLVLSAVISAVQNKNSLAIDKLEKAIKLVPAHFDANFSLGRAYFGNGDLDRSISAFRRAVSIQPNHLKARFFLATALELDGNSTDALKEYRAILQLDPENAEGSLGLGMLLLKIEGDKSTEGLNALQRAIALDDKLYEGQVALGKTLVRLNRTTEAIAHLKKAVDLAPNNPEPHFQLSIAYRKIRMKSEADAETEIVKRIHENHRRVSNKTPQ
jgi:tetratricopeptide (TPR) repeat protein